MIKKAILGVGVLLIAGLVLFGTGAFSYVRTSAGLVKESVHNSVPIEFQIQRARDMIDDLVPEIRKNMHVIAKEEVEVTHLEQQIADATVSAPRDGVITRRVAEPGEVLHPGATIAVLTDIARPWLTVWIDEPNLSQVNLGDPVEVRVDGTAQSFTGIVSFISPVAEFTPKNVQTPDERAKLVFRVKVSLDNTDRHFKPGMPGDAYFGVAGAGPAR